jgi:hypothetical protein
VTAVLLAALALGAGAGRQSPTPLSDDGGRLAVYLLTFGPGPRIWERFGHNAIWIRDTLTGTGPAYDFGRFSFEQTNFVLNFARGRMWYWMGRSDGVGLVNAYAGMERSVWLQELALPPAARLGLRNALEAALARERGLYRYDYYLDNCSTRVRDALDAALGGAIRRHLDTVPTGRSFRDHTRLALESKPITYFAVMAGLGPATDRPINPWEATFLPAELRDHLRTVMVPSGDTLRSVVLAEIQPIADEGRFAVPERAADWRLRFLALGALIGGLLATLGKVGHRRVRARGAFLTGAAAWLLFSSMAALVLIWLWAFSDHVAAWRNANLFHFNLLSAALLPLLPAVVRRPDQLAPGRVRVARLLASAVAASSLVGLALLWGGSVQQNAEVAALTLPAHLGLLVGLRSLTSTGEVRSPSPSPS